jgi:hypothetical protein
MKETKLDSLINLLDDPDDSVFQLVQEELLKEDLAMVDYLERVWETSMDELVQKRIENIIQKIQLNDTKEKIKNWANQKSIDLFEGFFLIARHQYPEVKLKPIQDHLEKIRKEIWLEFRNSLTSLEKISIMNHIFFKHYKFSVGKDQHDSPQHCYINRILETRKGNPISISILYTLIARSLNLPVHYIDFPENPLLGYFDKDIARIAHGDEIENPVLFYINPAHKGAVIGPKEIDYLHSAKEDQKRPVKPCPDRIVIKRLVEKLALAYKQEGVIEKVIYLDEIADKL